MSPALLRGILYVAFLISGATALIYEVVWSKYLALFVGGTSLAHTIVLATFMGGLAFGNAFFGRFADHPRLDKLKLYALLEIGIGLLCLLFPALFALLSDLYLSIGRQTGPGTHLNHALKILLAAASMFAPCALMGGTLPVLTKFIVQSLSSLGVRLSWLYCINTAGAVAGCFLGGFYVVEHWGLEFGMVGTSLVNSAIGGLFYAFARAGYGAQAADERGSTGGLGPSAEPPLSPPLEAAESEYSESQARTAFWCIAVAGGLSMLYELVWIRLLILSIGGTVHSFSMMLVSFISGIALGSALVGRLLRKRRNALALFGLCEVGIALSILVPLSWYERLPYAFFRVASWMLHLPETYSLFLLSQMGLAAALMVVPTTLMGAALPLASRVCVDRLDALGRRVGNVFSANTIGTVAGAAITGFLLLPHLGLQGTLLLGVGLSGALGVVLLRSWRPQGSGSPWQGIWDAVRTDPPALGPPAWVFCLALLCLTGGAQLAFSPRWDPRLLQAGLYRWERSWSFPSWEAFKAFRLRKSFLYSRDGADASVSVEGSDEADRVIRVNGKTDASAGPDLVSQLMVGHLGMFLHPDPKRVMVVGLGSGATAGAVLRHPGTTVDVAEISPEVVEAAAHFESVNDGVLRNPRMSLAILDAREFLLLTEEKYDVIVSEPTNLWIPGVAALFTKDFYSVVLDHLKPGGLFVQWVQMYAIDKDTVGSVVHTLGEAFPYLSAWVVEDADLMLVAGRERPPFDPERFGRRLEEVRPVEGHARANIPLAVFRHPLLFLSAQVATTDALRLNWPQGSVRIFRDLRPRLEFEAARAQFLGRPYLLLEDIDERVLRMGTEPLFIEEYLDRYPLDAGGRKSLIEILRTMTPAYRRFGQRLALGAILDGDPDPRLLVGFPDALAAKVLVARSLGPALDQGGPDSTFELCEAYLRAHGEALREGTSVFSRPSTNVLESRVEACVARYPDAAAALRASLAKVIAESGAVGPALERLQALTRGRHARTAGIEAKGRSARGRRRPPDASRSSTGGAGMGGARRPSRYQQSAGTPPS